MKLKKSTLQQIIKEELEQELEEVGLPSKTTAMAGFATAMVALTLKIGAITAQKAQAIDRTVKMQKLETLEVTKPEVLTRIYDEFYGPGSAKKDRMTLQTGALSTFIAAKINDKELNFDPQTLKYKILKKDQQTK